MLSLFIHFLLAINAVVSLLIILLVLMQRPKSEGLGAAFGGGMTENLFGAQTSNVLANFTRWLGGIFFFLTLLLSILYARQSGQHSAIQAAAIKAAAAAAAAEQSASPSAGVGALSGTGVLSGTAAPFGNSELKLGATPPPANTLLPTQALPATSPANAVLPAASPANALLPAPTLGATPAPTASPFPVIPGSSGKAGH